MVVDVNEERIFIRSIDFFQIIQIFVLGLKNKPCFPIAYIFFFL